MPIVAGRTVTFDIEVINQGTVAASGIEISDYIPTGLTLADADWTQNGNTAVYNTLINLPVGQVAVISIDFIVDDFVSGDLTNTSEVSDARDEQGDPADDIDSTPDGTNGNDTEVDDVVDGTGGDEDDADPATITVDIFDIALAKTINTQLTETPILQNRDVTFDITVTNQGTLDATDIEISDYIPAGLTLNDGAWTNNGGTAVFNQLLSLASGASQTITITFTVDTGTVSYTHLTLPTTPYV